MPTTPASTNPPRNVVYACDACGEEPGSPLITPDSRVVCLRCAARYVDAAFRMIEFWGLELTDG